jgi:hypothetical protein
MHINDIFLFISVTADCYSTGATHEVQIKNHIYKVVQI